MGWRRILRSRRKAKLASLLHPTQRDVFVQIRKFQGERLTPVEDRFDNVRCKESAAEDVPDILRAEFGFTSQRCWIKIFPLENFFAPGVTSNNSLDQ